MIQKLNLSTALAALVLFFFPWIDFQCSGKSLVTQTGIQTITGGASASPDLEALGAGKKNSSTGNNAPKAPLVALALLAITGAAIVALLSLRGGLGTGNTAGALCATALALLVVQVAVGFPAQRDLERKAQDQRGEVGGGKDPMAEMAAAALNIQTKFLPSFYLELAILALPALVLANGLLDRMKKP